MSAVLAIGRFAQLSGLSVKALRHYDEVGLLAPAHVDPESGYRWYRGSQARSGAIISVLRSMGVPLDVVRRVLEEPERSEGHLSRWRDDVEAERVRQEEAIAVGLRALASYERDCPVVRRQAPVQHYIGLPLDRQLLDGDPEAGAATMERGWQELNRLVTEAGATPTTAWTTIDPQDGQGAGTPVLWENAGRIVLCLGLQQPWMSDTSTPGHESGTLPARTELVVVLTPQGMPAPDARPGEAAPPAAVIALMDAIDRDGATAGTIRQMPLLDETGQFAGLEISVAQEATR
jgi:DNA-binding transcriptional MerR regulator